MNLNCDKLPALALGGAIVIAAVLFGAFYYLAQTRVTNDTLSVTGSAKARITSDNVKLVIAITRIIPVSQLAVGYEGVERDRALVSALLTKQGITNEQKTESPVSMNQNYDQNMEVGEPRYQLTQTVTVQSDDVNKITALAAEVPSLAAQGGIVSVQSLEYFYSNLPDLRVALLTDAVKDAKARADKIASGTGRSIGAVRSASSGVVQVLAPNSVNVEDSGAYDTSSIDKEVMVTVKTSFDLR